MKESLEKYLPLVEKVVDGLDGLEIAERKYDKRADFSFESYAVWWIRHSILQAIAEKSKS